MDTLITITFLLTVPALVSQILLLADNTSPADYSSTTYQDKHLKLINIGLWTTGLAIIANVVYAVTKLFW